MVDSNIAPAPGFCSPPPLFKLFSFLLRPPGFRSRLFDFPLATSLFLPPCLIGRPCPAESENSNLVPVPGFRSSPVPLSFPPKLRFYSAPIPRIISFPHHSSTLPLPLSQRASTFYTTGKAFSPFPLCSPHHYQTQCRTINSGVSPVEPVELGIPPLMFIC